MSEQQAGVTPPEGAAPQGQEPTNQPTTTPTPPEGDGSGAGEPIDDGTGAVDPRITKANQEAARYRTQLREAEAERDRLAKEAEDRRIAELSEKEQAEERAKAAEAERDAAVQRAQQALATSALTSAATSAKFHDPSDATTILLSQVTFDEAGSVDPAQVKQLVDELAVAKPHLVNRGGAHAGGAPGAAAPGQQPTKELSREALLAEHGLLR